MKLPTVEPVTAIERIWAAPPPPRREPPPVEIAGASGFMRPGQTIVMRSVGGPPRMALVARVEGDKVWFDDSGLESKTPAPITSLQLTGKPRR